MFSKLTIEQFLVESSKSTFPSPKGGSHAALAGACAAALVMMSAKVAYKKYDDNNDGRRLLDIEQASEQIRQELSNLINTDALAYYEVIQAYKLPSTTEIELEKRSASLSLKFLHATLTLIQIGHQTKQLFKLIKKLEPYCPTSCKGDLETAQYLARAAFASSLAGAKANLNKITAPKDQEELSKQLAYYSMELN